MSTTEIPLLEFTSSFDKMPVHGVDVGGGGSNGVAQNSIPLPHIESHESENLSTGAVGRRRSNSQSQVIATPIAGRIKPQEPKKRKQVQYFVTLTSLNDTFVQKHLSVPYYPETRKLGRPTGAKIKPDTTNGFFDSRVLSRNHAAMYIESNTGKLMLKDLGSSNGTFVNEVKLDKDPVEIKVGDNICFGFNIQVGINHKQINARVENINIMSNFLKTAAPETGKASNQVVDSIEYKHYQFVQELYNKVVESPKQPSPPSSKQLSFEEALFSDVNPDIEENLLGLFTKANNGIFKNSNTSSTTKLETSINQLLNIFAKVKQQANTLHSIEDYLSSYRSKLNELNENYVNQQISNKLDEINKQVEAEKSKRDKVVDEFRSYKEENLKKGKKLEDKIWRLREERQEISKKLAAMETELQSKQALLELHASHQEHQKEVQQSLLAKEIRLGPGGIKELTNDVELPGTPESVRQEDEQDAGNELNGNGAEPAHSEDNGHHDEHHDDESDSDEESSQGSIKYDEASDLAYKNNSLIVALIIIAIGFALHKYYSQVS